MKGFIIALLYSTVNKLLHRNVVQNIRELIIKYDSLELPGPDKKRLVLNELWDIAKVSLLDISNDIVSMAVDIAVSYLKNKKVI